MKIDSTDLGNTPFNQTNPQQYKVAAVVVTYNRAKMLIECIDALLGQTFSVGAVYVIDNASTDDTSQSLMNAGYLDHSIVHYIRLSENSGGAGGFTHGLSQAYRDGWDWIWLMDDDAQPSLDCLATLTDGLQKLCASSEKPVCICPRVFNFFTKEPEWHQHKRMTRYFMDAPVLAFPQRMNSIDGNAFVGPLFSRGCITKIGWPCADFFLWVDDLDFTYRVARSGELILDGDSIIWHKDHNPGHPGPDKCYYWVRNYLWFLLYTVRRYEVLNGINWLRWFLAIGIVIKRAFCMTRTHIHNRALPMKIRLLPIRALIHVVNGTKGRAPQ
jgi:GT2 family glycosyltransferase